MSSLLRIYLDTWIEQNFEDFHFIDLDDDKDRDLVFTGWSGAEPVCVRIFINKEEVFERVFDAFQLIKRIEFSGNCLSKLIIEDPGCCTEYILFTESYQINTHADLIKFELIDRTAMIQETELPFEFYETPMPFEVLNDRYFMRSSARIDTVDNYYDGERANNNVIAEFNKGAKGVVLGEKADITGRVWWFVEIDSKFKPVNTRFYDFNEKPTKFLGWMSSNYLRKK